MNEWCFSVQRGFCQHSIMIIGKTAHCLTNGMTTQKFIFTLGMEKSRVLDKGKYADKIMEGKENWRKVEKIPDNSYIIRDSDYCVSFLFWRCRLLSREDFF